MALNEGQTIQYTVITTRVTDGTVLYWKTTGNTTNSDIVGGNTGSVTITNNQGVFNVSVLADTLTDDTKTLGISLSTGSQSGPTVVSTANPITVNDSSQSPAYRLYGFGVGNVGRLGLNDDITRSSPTQIGPDINWNEISFGGQSALATKTNGTLWAWGDNPYGQIGTNDTITRSSPTQIGSLTNWSKVAVGQWAALATKTDGTLWAVGGWNLTGQLGINSSGNYRSSPVQVGSQTSWSNVFCGNFCTFAVSNGSLWAWGQNDKGQLGLNDRVYRSSPTQVSDGIFGTVDSITAGQSAVFAIATSGGAKTLYSWGGNAEGLLGLNDRITRSRPTQVGSTNDFATVAHTNFHVLATSPDGKLYGWGNNNFGQLGLNSVSAYGVYRSSRVQIGSGTDWAKAAVGSNRSHAIKTDGTLWAWGAGSGGFLGLNDTITRSSPTQVGSATNWNKISSGSFTTILTTLS